MPEITWVQLGLPVDLLEQIDALIGIAGSDRSSVMITLLKETIPRTANHNRPTILERLASVEQQLAEVQQAISDLQHQSARSTTLAGSIPPTSTRPKVEPIPSTEVPDDWIEEPYEVLTGFLPADETSIRKRLMLATDEAEHDFLEEPDEVLTDFLEP